MNILFDWDETLAKTRFAKICILISLMIKYKPNIIKGFQAAVEDKGTFEILMASVLNVDISKLKNDYIYLFKKYSKLVKIKDKEFIKKLKFGIVTNDLKENVEFILKREGLSAEVIIGYEDCDKKKPNPEPILLALKKLKSGIYVGNSNSDMIAAHKAGLKAVGFAKYKKLKDADKIISNLKELHQFT